MPEGPELHLASLYVNRMCEGVLFSGPVIKSEVSKNPDVPFTSEAYRITAASRGKEVKLTLTPIKTDEPKRRVKPGQVEQPIDIVFRFGMSGYFRFTSEDELPKHAHLRFYSKEKPCRVLSFVDPRRFGRWEPNGTWQPARGPCVMFEYKEFRENVVSHVSDRAFDRPICEVLLNQKYFNGIGNYLRSEILFRSNISPFVAAKTVLEGLGPEDQNETPVKKESAAKSSQKPSVRTKKKPMKHQTDDLLRLCHTVPLEVVNLGGKGYDPASGDFSDFVAWLQCYNVDGMKSLQDHNGRTIWFRGDPGPMAPKDSKSPKAKNWAKKDDGHDYTSKKKGARERKTRIKQEGVMKTPKKEKDARPEEAESKRRKTGKKHEVKTPQRETRSNARRRKTGVVEVTVGSQRRTMRTTR